MNETIQGFNHSTGTSAAPPCMPEEIRITLLAAVTEQLIQLRRKTPGIVQTYQLSRLIPAAQWLTGDGDQSGKFRALGETYQYEVEAVHVDEFGHVERVDEDSQANTFSVYRRPRDLVTMPARAEFVGDFDTRDQAQKAANAAAMQDTGAARGH